MLYRNKLVLALALVSAVLVPWLAWGDGASTLAKVIAVTQSGTWTVQPGNTANTTPWLTTDSATSATGSAIPAKAGYVGGNSGGNLTGLIVCNNTAKYDASTSGSTQVVAASGSTVIYVCGYDIQVGGTATNVKLVYGTGTNCATSPADITPAYQMAANGGRVLYNAIWGGLKTTSSQALCVNASAANAVQVLVYYTQF